MPSREVYGAILTAVNLHIIFCLFCKFGKLKKAVFFNALYLTNPVSGDKIRRKLPGERSGKLICNYANI